MSANKINNAIGVSETALSTLEHKLLVLKTEINENKMSKNRFSAQITDIFNLIDITKNGVSKMKFFILSTDHRGN